MRKDYTVLKTVSEIISFSMRLMVAFGGTTQFGPVTCYAARVRSSSRSIIGLPKGPTTEAPQQATVMAVLAVGR